MKKLFWVFILSLITITLVGCSKKTELEKTLDELNDAKSLTMTFDMDVPFLGEIEAVSKIDGDKEYYLTFMQEYYLSTEDGVQYKYSKDISDNWIKEEYDDSEDDDDSVDPTEFKDSWFEKEENKYVLKEEYYDEVLGTDVGEVKQFDMEIEDDKVIINYEVSSEGFVIKAVITITDINNTSIQLPTVSE